MGALLLRSHPGREGGALLLHRSPAGGGVGVEPRLQNGLDLWRR